MNIKTEAARQYEIALNQDLRKYKAAAEAFASDFDPKTQHLVAFWQIYSPNVLTKDGAVSRNGTDLDAHKVLQDVIMKFVGIDDAYIVSDTRMKIQGEYKVDLTLRIVENNGSDLL